MTIISEFWNELYAYLLDDNYDGKKNDLFYLHDIGFHMLLLKEKPSIYWL